MSESEFRWRPRRGKAASWSSQNPVLLEAELGVEKDTDRFKIGDGTTAWNDLPYHEATPLILAAADELYVSIDDYDPAAAVPSGGTTGQVLAKASDTDLDTEWVDQAAGGGGLDDAGVAALVNDDTTPSDTRTALDALYAALGSGGTVDSIVAGTNIAVDATDPANPIVSTDAILESVVAGTNVTVDNTDPANPIVSATGGGSPSAQVDVFTTTRQASAWAVPSGAAAVSVELRGCGGPGGSGRKGAPGSARRAGQPGGVGGLTQMTFDAASLPATLYLWIGSGGTGGSAISANSTNGQAGTGSFDTFISTSSSASLATAQSAAIALAENGGNGSGGTTAAASAPSPGGGTEPTPANGAGYNGNGNGGGDTTSTNVSSAGGSARMTTIDTAGTTLGGMLINGGAVGANGVDASTAGAVTAGALQPLGGSGGGAGVATGTGNGGRGGHGIYGGGGGGGGAGTDGVGDSGAGGNGGAGYIVITTYF